MFSPPDKVDFNNLKGKDMDEIRKYGEDYLGQNKKKLQEMIEPIVDQRYKAWMWIPSTYYHIFISH